MSLAVLQMNELPDSGPATFQSQSRRRLKRPAAFNYVKERCPSPPLVTGAALTHVMDTASAGS
jgi:hypothetical protein